MGEGGGDSLHLDDLQKSRFWENTVKLTLKNLDNGSVADFRWNRTLSQV